MTGLSAGLLGLLAGGAAAAQPPLELRSFRAGTVVYEQDALSGAVTRIECKDFNGGVHALQVPFNWGTRLVANDAWTHGFMSLRWLRPLQEEFQKTGDAHFLLALKSVLDDFYQYHFVDQGHPDPLFQGDHTMAIRLRFFSECYSLFRRRAEAWATETTAHLRAMLRHHLAVIQTTPVYRPHTNHGAMVDQAICYTVLSHPDLDPKGTDFHAAEERFSQQIQGIFGPDGVTREHSVAYQLYNLGIVCDQLEVYKHFTKPPPALLSTLIEQGQEFLGYAMLPDGTLPAIGDTERALLRPAWKS